MAFLVGLLCGVLLVYGIQKYGLPKGVTEAMSEEETPEEHDSLISHEAGREAEKQVDESSVSSLGFSHQVAQWQQFEASLTELYQAYLILIEERFHPNTVAIFLPVTDAIYSMRAHMSNDETLLTSAQIMEGGDLVGGYLKEGITEALIDVSSSQDVAYYSAPGRVQSILMAPITAMRSAGFIVVDSTENGAFSADDLRWLSRMGGVLGNTLYYGYLYQQHRLMHEEVAAVQERSRRFISTRSVDDLLQEVVAVFRDAFAYDRLTISLKDEEREVGRVVSADGAAVDALLGAEFPLDESSLANIFYGKSGSEEMPRVLNRHFSPNHYEVRYHQSEPRTKELRSFVALPLGVGNVRGVVLLESAQEQGYTQKDIENIARVTDTVSIALEKMLIIEQQERLAIRDGLTGLYNHRQFERLLHETIARSHRLTAPGDTNKVEKVPVALVLGDIDFFKRVNDSHGHKFGDHVLQQVASTLENGIREGVDFAARYGGEEFALILYDTDDRGAYETVNRVRESIASIQIKTPLGEDFQVTMSFGIAMYDRDAKKQEELVQKSDKALYRAKENGRNCVELYCDLAEVGE